MGAFIPDAHMHSFREHLDFLFWESSADRSDDCLGARARPCHVVESSSVGELVVVAMRVFEMNASAMSCVQRPALRPTGTLGPAVLGGGIVPPVLQSTVRDQSKLVLGPAASPFAAQYQMQTMVKRGAERMGQEKPDIWQGLQWLLLRACIMNVCIVGPLAPAFPSEMASHVARSYVPLAMTGATASAPIRLLVGGVDPDFSSLTWLGIVSKTPLLFMQWIRDYQKISSTGSMAVFSLSLATAVVLMLPCAPFEISAGVLFGFWPGWVVSVLGKQVGNAAAFQLGRIVLRDWVQTEILPKYQFLQAMGRAAEKEPLKTCFCVRAAYVPLMVKNYGLAVLNVSFLEAMCASMVCGPLYSLQNVYIGHSALSVFQALNDKSSVGNMGVNLACGALGLTASLCALTMVQRHLQQVLEENAEE